MRAGIALGANLGDRLRSLTMARERILALPNVAPPLLSSALYETEPVECEAGAEKFLNAVVEIGYAGSSQQLLEALREIEVNLGRPSEHTANHSRTIDLDLLYHGARVIDEPHLQLPHPRIQLRGFVLHPLAEIRPNFVIPGETRTIGELSAELAHAPSVVRSPLQW
ncbi:MAG TPA: 2-amino-4-hydroxy-6-hydroxymethyldihydropteridine diphosphokinase [Chthoniobacterales bacterium]|jgi:2-amino-4-hydroxy-6-hydroxymethyldihydropteridine diphosphokinase